MCRRKLNAKVKIYTGNMAQNTLGHTPNIWNEIWYVLCLLASCLWRWKSWTFFNPTLFHAKSRANNVRFFIKLRYKHFGIWAGCFCGGDWNTPIWWYVFNIKLFQKWWRDREAKNQWFSWLRYFNFSDENTLKKPMLETFYHLKFCYF